MIILSGPNDLDIFCSDIPLQPDLVPEMTTCLIEKDQMVSGEYDLTLISNNGDGAPFGNVRSFTITASPQETVTV